MAVNHVIFGGETLIDLRSDTVTTETLAEGVTAHDASGNAIVGTASIGSTASLENRVSEVESVLNTLATEQSIYNELKDANGNVVYDENGEPIQAKVAFYGSVRHYKISIGTLWEGVSAPYIQNIQVPGIMSIDNPHVDILLSDDFDRVYDELDSWGYIYRITTFDGGIKIYASEPTETTINIQMEVHR